MRNPRVVVLGGGLSGLAAAYALAEGGWTDISILEGGPTLGGLAGSFELEGRFYPLGYHHILHRDKTLLFFLDRIGALSKVRWRKIHMLFEAESGLYDLGRPADFVRFPLPLASKIRFLRMMLRAATRNDWDAWQHQSGAALIETWADPLVRRVLFDPLIQLKFHLSCSEISAAWLGMRLNYREGSAPLGYIPGANWTKILCDGAEKLVTDRGIKTRRHAVVEKLHVRGDRAVGVLLNSGETIDGDVFVSTIPSTSYLRLCRDDQTPNLRSIRYSALLSMVCSTAQDVRRNFYWLNLATGKHAAGGLFALSSLNPTIGKPGEVCLNFVTHLPSRDERFFRASDDEIIGAYLADFQQIFRFDLQPSWVKLSRIPIYSPVFVKNYASPPIKSTLAGNVFFAGSYRTGPSISSTGTALMSGLETACGILREHGRDSAVHAMASAFRGPSWFNRLSGNEVRKPQ